MPRLPPDYSLLGDLSALRRDLKFVRQLRELKVITASGGDIPLDYAAGAANTVLDLRSLTSTGAASAAELPDPTGHAGAVLLSDGATAYWSRAETGAWVARVRAAGGTFAANSVGIADSLFTALADATYLAKLRYFAPLLGGNLAAARVPLIDTLSAGNLVNSGFGNADFSQTAGLAGGTGKRMTLPVAPSALGATNNGGLGWWELDAAGGFVGGDWPIGIVNNLVADGRFLLAISSGSASFRWGANANAAAQTAAQGNGHYYGQRASATDRRLFRAGAQVASNTSSDGANGAGNAPFGVMSLQRLDGAPTLYWGGRCGAMYLTTGVLTAGEAADFHTLLQTHLITPTGRA